MSIDIRRLGPDDEDVLARIAREADDFDLAGASQPEAPARRADGGGLPRRSAVARSIWVAEEGGVVVGELLCHVLRLPSGSGRELLLYSIGVRAAHRRRGVGTALVREMLAWARGERIEVVWVLADNPGAEAFYAACGFAPGDEEQAVYLQRRVVRDSETPPRPWHRRPRPRRQRPAAPAVARRERQLPVSTCWSSNRMCSPRSRSERLRKIRCPSKSSTRMSSRCSSCSAMSRKRVAVEVAQPVDRDLPGEELGQALGAQLGDERRVVDRRVRAQEQERSRAAEHEDALHVHHPLTKALTRMVPAARAVGDNVALRRRPVYSVAVSAPSPRKRLKQATDLLDDFYGRPVLSPRYPPVDELVFTVLSQNTADVNTERTLRVAQGAVPGVDRGARRVRRGDRGGHRPRRPRPHQGAAHQAHPRGDQRADRRARPQRARRHDRPGGAGLPRRAARGRAQDGRVRAALRARAAGHARGHARAPRRAAARHHRREGDRRPGAPAAHRAGRPGRRGAGLRRARGLRAARPPHLPRPAAGVRGVPARADVPVGRARLAGRQPGRAPRRPRRRGAHGSAFRRHRRRCRAQHRSRRGPARGRRRQSARGPQRGTAGGRGPRRHRGGSESNDWRVRPRPPPSPRDLAV